MHTESLYAIMRSDQQLVCWKGSKGIPFMSPSRHLVESTLVDADVIDSVQDGEIIQVWVLNVDDKVIITYNNTILSVLVPSGT